MNIRSSVLNGAIPVVWLNVVITRPEPAPPESALLAANVPVNRVLTPPLLTTTV